ncbi:MAG TPA: DUF1015 domain-containing protein, partial [Polyangiaceae bacterium]
RDLAPAFYRYDQTFAPPGGGSAITRRGFLALVRLVPFSAKIVLPHERTLSGPKEDRWKLFQATETNLSPGFMLYRDPGRALDAAIADGTVLATFRTDDGVENTLSQVTRPDSIDAIVEGIAGSSLLIADGHHRYETALRYAQHATGSHRPGALADGEHRFFMSFLANGDDPGLVVFPTHRHVHSLPSFAFDGLLARARETFEEVALPTGAGADILLGALREAGARGPSFVAASRDGRAVVLTLRTGLDLSRHPTLGRQPEVLRRTDVVVLHSGLLEGALGITPEAQAAKINLWYPQDAAAAMAELRGAPSRGDVLFLMNATPVAEVRAVAEAGLVMPQKSTFFYPKVPTGLAIHTLDPTRPVANPGASLAVAAVAPFSGHA